MERTQKTNFACLIAASLCFAAALGSGSFVALSAEHLTERQCLPCTGPAGACRERRWPPVLTAARLFVAAGAAVVVFLQAIGMYDTPLWRLVGAVAGTALGL